MLLYVTLTLAAYALVVSGAALHQRREIAQLRTRLDAQTAAHDRHEKAAYRRGWNKALAKAYPYGVIPERCKCPEEDKSIATS